MVKGISKQVIVVHSPDPKLFEQAIFIVRNDAYLRREHLRHKQHNHNRQTSLKTPHR